MRCRRNFPAQRKKLSFAGQLCAHRSRTLPPQRLTLTPSPQVLNFASCDDLRFHDRPCRRTASGVTSHFCHLSSFLSVSQGTNFVRLDPAATRRVVPPRSSPESTQRSRQRACIVHPSPACSAPQLSSALPFPPFVFGALAPDPPSLVIFQLELSSHDHDTTKTKTPTT